MRYRYSRNLEKIFTCVILCFVIFGIIDIIKLRCEKNNKLNELEKLNEKSLKQEKINKKLTEQLSKKSEKYTEQMARELFDYAYPEERVFVDVSGNF